MIKQYDNFEQFFKDATVLDPIEIVEIDNIGEFEAKVDTGNDGYNVLHGENIEYNDSNNSLSFTTVNGISVNGMTVYKHVEVNVGAGNTEDRPIIKLTFTLNGQKYTDCEFSIGDRATNSQKVLLGRKFLSNKNVFVKL